MSCTPSRNAAACCTATRKLCMHVYVALAPSSSSSHCTGRSPFIYTLCIGPPHHPRFSSSRRGHCVCACVAYGFRSACASFPILAESANTHCTSFALHVFAVPPSLMRHTYMHPSFVLRLLLRACIILSVSRRVSVPDVVCGSGGFRFPTFPLLFPHIENHMV